MASPHTPDDLLQPQGDLTPGMFPQLDAAQLDALLQSYLDAGYARAEAYVPPVAAGDLDDAAMAWAYHQAYLNVWRRLSLAPSTVHVEGEVSRQYLITQIQNWRDMADTWLATFTALLPTTSGTQSVQTVVANVPTRTVF